MTVLIYKFVTVEPNRVPPEVDEEDEVLSWPDRPETYAVPKLVGEYEDLDAARDVIGSGEFAVYEAEGDRDESTGLHSAFTLVQPDKPVVVLGEPEVTAARMTRKKQPA